MAMQSIDVRDVVVEGKGGRWEKTEGKSLVLVAREASLADWLV